MSTTPSDIDPMLIQTHDTIYHSTFCVGIDFKATKIYLQCLKDLITRYLNAGTYVYISTDDNLLSLYQSIWPIHQHLFYTNYGFIPFDIPSASTASIVYFYHHPKIKQSIIDQLTLTSFSETHPNIKYVYVGNLCKITQVTIVKMFRYYFYFNNKANGWSGISLPILNISSRILRNKYRVLAKKKKTCSRITLYDYFIFCDVLHQTKTICNFNKKILLKKKKKKPIPKTTATENTNNSSNLVKIQYIYTDTPNNFSHLIMPDGKKENFNDIAKQYSNLIEI